MQNCYSCSSFVLSSAHDLFAHPGETSLQVLFRQSSNQKLPEILQRHPVFPYDWDQRSQPCCCSVASISEVIVVAAVSINRSVEVSTQELYQFCDLLPHSLVVIA